MNPDAAHEATRIAYLKTALEHWRTTGEWPTVRQVHRHVVRELGIPAQLMDVIEFFRHRTGASGPDSKAGLLLRDLVTYEPSANELNQFVGALKLCVRRFYESEKPELTSGEVADELSLGPVEVRKLYDLIHDAYHVTVGSYGPDPEGQWKIQV